jgi:uncharacterized protein YbjQ (UPF0145 family)
MDGITGMLIARTLGIVVGIAIHSRGVGGNILARMAAEAEERGANAVVAVRFDSAEVGREMVEVVAYGTAPIVVAAP